jgi:hypothetical protein
VTVRDPSSPGLMARRSWMTSWSSGSGARSSGLEQVERSALNGESGQTGFCPAGVVSSGVPCGIEFRAEQPEQIDEFVAAA